MQGDRLFPSGFGTPSELPSSRTWPVVLCWWCICKVFSRENVFILYELSYEWVLLLTLIQETCWLSVRVWVKPFGPWGYWKGTGETKERPSARCHYAEPESNRIWKIHFTPCLCPVLINVYFQLLTFPEHCRRVSGNRCPGAWRRRRTDLPSLRSRGMLIFTYS